jgi:hypothetical protein
MIEEYLNRMIDAIIEKDERSFRAKLSKTSRENFTVSKKRQRYCQSLKVVKVTSENQVKLILIHTNNVTIHKMEKKKKYLYKQMKKESLTTLPL